MAIGVPHSGERKNLAVAFARGLPPVLALVIVTPPSIGGLAPEGASVGASARAGDVMLANAHAHDTSVVPNLMSRR